MSTGKDRSQRTGMSRTSRQTVPSEPNPMGNNAPLSTEGERDALTTHSRTLQPITEGIDVSIDQGGINWSQVRQSGKRFAMIKATEGNDYQDNMFPENWMNSKKAGMLRIAYHFLRPGISASVQVDNFHEWVRKHERFHIGDGIMIDVELDDGCSSDTVIQCLREFIVKARKDINKPIIIYTGWYFWIYVLGNPVDNILSSCAFNLADYGPIVSIPSATKEGLAFWQYSDTGHCPGVNGYVDLDRFYGDINQLREVLHVGK